MKFHGLSRDPLFRRWKAIHQRCYDKTAAHYERYGARGVTVCEDWHDVHSFREWALANGYEPELQLDRIDTSKGYGPENCRFVTPSKNMRNTRRALNLTLGGVTKHAKEWALITGVPYKTIHMRRSKGWPDELALLTSVVAGKQQPNKSRNSLKQRDL